MSLEKWTPEPDYSSDKNDLIQDFYLPALSASIAYDRISGYFRSSIYVLIWRGLVDFVDRGGRIRILCSPEMSVDDAEAVVRGYRSRSESELAEALSRELDEMMGSTNLRTPSVVLAGLISEGIVELQIAQVRRIASPTADQLFHDKVGLFTDASGATLGFRGSANETLSGFSPVGNVESIDAFPSWCDGRDAQRARRASERFERLWANREPGVDVRPLPEEFVDRLRSAAPSEWRKTVAELEELDRLAQQARETTPSGRSLRPQQAGALEVWENNGRRGILEHATGAGKTLTGVTAVGRHLSSGGSALIVVPSSLLLDQWAADLQEELGPAGVRVNKCGGGDSSWKDLLRDWLTEDLGRRVVVAVTNTAASGPFLAQARHANGLLLVADEVHRLGAPRNQAILGLDADARMGLSATPARAGDDDGTNAILEYFGGVIHRFGLRDAIDAGLLTPYRYETFAVRLNEDEQEEWESLSKRIRRQAAIAMSSTGSTDRSHADLKRLLILRSRIAKKAAAKPGLAGDLLQQRFERGQRWLVYCDDADQLAAVVAEVRALGLPVGEYHSQMAGDPAATLQDFKINGGILVSIKCLDEGVDIPAATHALILASSRNPREFIQRRGRVLRQSPDKTLAHVFDAITLPEGELDTDSESLVWGEIARAAEFAEGAVNADARHTLERICQEIGIDLADLYSALRGSADRGFEADDEDA